MTARIRLGSSLLLTFGAVLLMSVSASASELVDAKDPKKILNIAKKFGTAELGRDRHGDPVITGRMEDTRYLVYFYGCTDGEDCTDIQLNAGWSEKPVSLKALNEWNRKMRYGKAFVDNDGDPVLQMSMNIDFGVSEKNLEDNFKVFRSTLRRFLAEVLDD